jgi:ankyrin repeat protein
MKPRSYVLLALACLSFLNLFGMQEPPTKKARTLAFLYQAFTQAIDTGDMKTLSQLCKVPGAVNNADSEDSTPLHYAIKKQNLEAVQLLVQLGANVNVPTTNASWKNFTPLHRAVCSGNEKIVHCLLEHGAYVDVRAINNNVPLKELTPLYCAILGGYLKIVELLIRYEANINPFYTPLPLLAAVERENLPIVKCLVNQGANVNGNESSPAYLARVIPIHMALNKNNIRMTKFLLNNGAHNSPDVAGFTPLYYAAQKNQWSLILRLLSRGAQVDGLVDQKKEALMKAIETYPLTAAFLANDLQKAEKLLTQQVKPDDLKEALYCAIEKGSIEGTLSILGRGANLQKAFKSVRNKLRETQHDEQKRAIYMFLKKQIIYRLPLVEQVLYSNALATALKKSGPQSLPSELKERIEKAGYTFLHS